MSLHDSGRATTDQTAVATDPKAGHDFLAFGIAVAAIILLVANGGTVLPHMILYLLGEGSQPDLRAANALILNIALVIFGWRRYVDLTHELVERRRAEAHARLLAETDPLTGCFNRRSIGDASAKLFEAARNGKSGVAVMMLDLDGFKQINDIHGHRTGDKVLVRLSERVRILLPSDAVIARIGGDELAVVLPAHPDRPGMVDALAEEMLADIARPLTIDGTTLETSGSLGLTMATGKDIPINDDHLKDAIAALLHQADMAMYHAKKHGRNCHFWFEPAMENELRMRNELELAIRQGVVNGEFVPYYEQQIEIESGRLSGFEMLARWHSPQLGVVSPDIFIPIAEENGIIGEMSEGLIRLALSDAKNWDPSLTLSINISPVQLRDPWFAQRLLRLLVEAGFPPNRLDVEITESGLHENVNLVRSAISSLKNQGVKVSLDDFGTGYSSLSQLNDLPFDQIKIDRSFVTKLSREGTSSTIVESIVKLGRGLNVPLIAEGIESKEVLAALKKLGQFKGQGYLYGRPEDAATTNKRLASLGLLIPKPEEAEPPTNIHPIDNSRKIG